MLYRSIRITLSLLFVVLFLPVSAQNDRSKRYLEQLNGFVRVPKKYFLTNGNIYLLNSKRDTLAICPLQNDITTQFFNLGYSPTTRRTGKTVKMDEDLILVLPKTNKDPGEISLIGSSFGPQKDKIVGRFTEKDATYEYVIGANEHKAFGISYSSCLICFSSEILAKILYGTQEKKPLKNGTVLLLSSKGDTLKKTQTDEFGDFAFKDVSSLKKTQIVVPVNEQIKDENILYVANQNGAIVSAVKKIGSSFVYQILPSDLYKLQPVEEADAAFEFGVFAKSPQKKLVVTENIYYESGKYDLTVDAIKKLETVLTIMSKNPATLLTIYSHTDSKGDDRSNLELSQKRSEAVVKYLVDKGIDKRRLTAKGMGESKPLNRCTNGANCSEKEHALNRRTEFEFSK